MNVCIECEVDEAVTGLLCDGCRAAIDAFLLSGEQSQAIETGTSSHDDITKGYDSGR